MITLAQLNQFFPLSQTRCVLVVGDLMLDQYIWGDTSRISPEAPVPVVSVQKESFSAGGAGNVAVNLSSLMVNCEVCGILGKDTPGGHMIDLFRERGIVFNPRFQLPGVSTIRKTRVVVRKQQICRIDYESNPEDYRIEMEDHREYLMKACERADAVIVCDYAKGGVSEILVKELTQIIRRKGGFVLIDPKPKHWVPMWDMDVLTPNRQEAYQLAEMAMPFPEQEFPAAEICLRIFERYAPRHLVITLGESGILYSRSGKVEFQSPTRARELFDVSGAGDTVVAALAVGVLAGMDFPEAIAFANCAAGVVVGKLGTATATVEEIRQVLESN